MGNTFDLTGSAQSLAQQALDTLADVMTNGKDRDRVAAAKEVLARGHGNAYTQAAPSTMQSQIAQQLAGMTDAQLLAVAQAARGQLAVPIVGQSVSPTVAEGGGGQNEGPQAGGIAQGTLKANFQVENNQSAMQNSQVENISTENISAPENIQVENPQPAQRNKPEVKRPRGRPRKQQPEPVDNLPAEEDDLLT